METFPNNHTSYEDFAEVGVIIADADMLGFNMSDPRTAILNRTSSAYGPPRPASLAVRSNSSSKLLHDLHLYT